MIELFSRNFDHPDDGGGSGGLNEPKPAPSLSPAEVTDLLDAARAAAYAEGFEAGGKNALQDMAEDQATKQAEAAEKIAGELALLGTMAAELRKRADMQAVELLNASLKQLLPALMNGPVAAEIRQQIRKGLACAHDSAELSVQLSPDMAERFASELLAWRAQTAPDLQVTLTPDPTLSDAALRMDWHGGGLRFDMDATCAAITQALQDTAASLGDGMAQA